jgi:hypothetical protein
MGEVAMAAAVRPTAAISDRAIRARVEYVDMTGEYGNTLRMQGSNPVSSGK